MYRDSSETDASVEGYWNVLKEALLKITSRNHQWPEDLDLRQNIWKNVRKSTKIDLDLKTLISAFALFLTTLAKFLFPGGEPGIGLLFLLVSGLS